MKQKISVRALIKKEEKILFLRRAQGRATILGKYELPGGKIEYNEQPEDALARLLQRHTATKIQVIQLFDVLTYIDHDDRDVQYIFIVYLVNLVNSESIEIGPRYDRLIWSKISEISSDSITDSTQILLGLSQQILDDSHKSTVSSLKNDMHVLFSDGGSRGNPGPSAAGFVLFDAKSTLISDGGVYLGITTNTQAEYHGVLAGLVRAKEVGARRVECRIDNLMIVNQMNGMYRIKNRELWPLYERLKSLSSEFDAVTFVHVKREFNTLADGMVNKILDAHQN